jgi:glycosyltransferase involved in cell wall biosynthesis/2-polyprenyl-3-methyl-5-hydroxy-6-metoxy-1,4-benzoquinol methylase
MTHPDHSVDARAASAVADRVELPRVSVVVPCLNRADYITLTLDSILAQDYPNVECIVMDGGSTDGTVELVEREYGGRVTLVSGPDEGHADAINKGWWRSTGEILAWLNADDVWLPGAVRTAIDYLIEHPDVDMVYGDCASINEQGELVGKAHHAEWDLRYAVEHCDYSIPQPASFIRRGILEKVGWLDASFIQKKDHELWLRIGRHGTIKHIPVMLAGAMGVPGYMGYRGDFTAETCVRITRKFFQELEDESLFDDIHERAMSNSYLTGALYAWNEGFHWRTALRYAMRAMEIDPSNARRVLARLRHQFAKEDTALTIRYIEQIDQTEGSLAVFGYTALARQLVIEFDDRMIPYIIDNDAAKQGERFNGVEVVSVRFARCHPPDVIAVASTVSAAAMRRQLEQVPEFRNAKIVTTHSTVMIDLSGDRDVEHSWMAAQMPPGPGRALDFGSGFGSLGLMAAQRGYDVTAVDLRDVFWHYAHPAIAFTRGDLFDLDLPEGSYDLILNCSTVEHVGLGGRYGSAERTDGDLDAMRRLWALIKPGGTMLMTVPVGRDTVCRPLHRVYGRERLPRLLDGWTVERSQFWIKDETNTWIPCDDNQALDFQPTEKVYGLGCFVLRRPAA